MSFFEDASIVLIPSGIKNQKIYSVKPTDGTGDLTFSRASSATRVASNGLIEKVRTNVVTYSQDLGDASWSKTALTISTSATANPLNGALTAQDAIPTAVSSIHRVFKLAGVVSTANTWSIYAKAKGYNFITIVENGNTSASVSFNLSTGSVSTQNSAVGQIQSLGSGWFRCSMIHTTSSTPRFDVCVSPTDSLSSYTGDGTSGVTLFGAQAEVSDFGATDYIATTTAAVSVGPVSGLPRLDYLNSTCPRLLLEPQRTNTSPYSEQFTSGWASSAGSPVTVNTTVSPSGYQDADTIAETGNGNYLYQSVTTSSGTFTVSVFAKKGSSTNVGIGLVAGGFTSGMSVQFNFDTQTFATPTNHGSFTSISATSQNYGNGWYRLALTGTTATATTYFFVLGSLVGSAYAANVRLWGAQCEAGAYATSYIPTLGASVTRVADAASKTGISSLIGQTEGTAFIECTVDTTNSNGAILIYLGSSDGGGAFDYSTYLIFQGSALSLVVYSGGTIYVNSVSSQTYVNNQTLKVAFAYKANDFVCYANGVQLFTDTSGTVSTNLSSVSYGSYPLNIPFNQYNGKISQALLFKTRLTNAQLAELTA